MKKKYEVDLSAQYTVEFPDEQKVIDYFIDGTWKESFFEFSDIEDMVSSIIYSFIRTDTQLSSDTTQAAFWYKEIEGYPPFIRDKDDRDLFVASHEECGTIIVKLEDELEVGYVTEK